MPGDPAWDRLADAFAELVSLPEASRAEALDRLTAGDPELRARLAAMLAADARPAHPLDRGVAETAGELIGQPPEAPRQVGPYRLGRLLGEGGSAVVYLAGRADLEHEVAIKILRDAWLSPARRERFLQEQRILARLNHPAIARFHDADSFPDGTPWLAMEYVAGVPVTDYAEQKRLDLRDRLRLVRAVAEAIQYAHQHAVIHRDLKPSNVLVTEAGAVKVLDFGVAKHLQDPGDPARTRTGLRPLTPAYAAPEQLGHADVGTYTDVYALGVVCYQLLTGRLPFDPAGPTAADLAGPERTAPPPSAHFPPGTSRGFATELDVLCSTAMHPDPARRYRDMGALMEDIDHLLAGEPLRARPDTVGYRAGKFRVIGPGMLPGGRLGQPRPLPGARPDVILSRPEPILVPTDRRPSMSTLVPRLRAATAVVIWFAVPVRGPAVLAQAQEGIGLKVGDTVNVATGQGPVLAIVRGVDGHLFNVQIINGPEVLKRYPGEVRRRGRLTGYDHANGLYDVDDRVKVHYEGQWIDSRIITVAGMEYQVALPGSLAGWARPDQLRFVSEAPPKEVAVAGQPPRPGLVSCAGKIEGRYAASGPMPVQMTFRSGKVTLSMMGGTQTGECWTGGGKILITLPGEEGAMEIDINDDGSLQAPFGELTKKGR